MGSKRIAGVRFRAYPDDHPPPHVHGFYAEVSVIVALLDTTVDLASRDDAVVPDNGSRADVRHVLQVARRNLSTLKALWEMHHGKC